MLTKKNLANISSVWFCHLLAQDIVLQNGQETYQTRSSQAAPGHDWWGGQTPWVTLEATTVPQHRTLNAVLLLGLAFERTGKVLSGLWSPDFCPYSSNPQGLAQEGQTWALLSAEYGVTLVDNKWEKNCPDSWSHRNETRHESCFSPLYPMT